MDNYELRITNDECSGTTKDTKITKAMPEIRFKGFSDEWEEKALGDVAEKITEKNTTSLYTETFTNSAEYGLISQRDFFDHDITNGHL